MVLAIRAGLRRAKYSSVERRNLPLCSHLNFCPLEHVFHPRASQEIAWMRAPRSTLVMTWLWRLG